MESKNELNRLAWKKQQLCFIISFKIKIQTKTQVLAFYFIYFLSFQLQTPLLTNKINPQSIKCTFLPPIICCHCKICPFQLTLFGSQKFSRCCNLLWNRKKGDNFSSQGNSDTLYNAILRIARNFLETSKNIKISTHPFYHVNLDWFPW
jgi:hypothetical protein